MRKESQELQPRPFFTDLPPRRMGLKVIRLLVVLFAGIYLGTLVYTAVDNRVFNSRDLPPALATADREAQERHFAHHNEAQRRLWEWSEKIEMALISLLGAAVGYSLKTRGLSSDSR